MKHIKRSLSGMLVLLLLCGTACGTADPVITDTTTALSAETTLPETTAAPVETEISPELESRDFEGKTFNILAQRWSSYAPLDYVDITVTESTGEVLNDAAYNRNLIMEDKYNCKVNMIQVDGDSGLSTLARDIMSNNGEYDVVLLRGIHAASAVTNNYLTDFSTLPHVDISQPWWYGDSYQTLAVNGKQYIGMSYVTTNHMNAVWTVCFNKKMVSEMSLDDPYELVSSGKWTFDKAIEMSKLVASDLNGDSVMNADDRWGINHTRDTVIGILNSCGVQIAEMRNGKMEVTIDSEVSIDRMQDILTKLFNEEYAMDTMRPTMQAYNSDGEFFAEGNILFLFTATHLIGHLRQMDLDFGMLPYPKYTESEDYRSTAAGIFSTLTTVPVSVKDPDAVGYFLEAYTYEGYRLLKPAYYDNILQGKVIRDEESGAVLDDIYGNLTYDAGNLYNIGEMSSAIGELSNTLNTNIASFLKIRSRLLQKAVDTFNQE